MATWNPTSDIIHLVSLVLSCLLLSCDFVEDEHMRVCKNTTLSETLGNLISSLMLLPHSYAL